MNLCHFYDLRQLFYPAVANCLHCVVQIMWIVICFSMAMEKHFQLFTVQLYWWLVDRGITSISVGGPQAGFEIFRLD